MTRFQGPVWLGIVSVVVFFHTILAYGLPASYVLIGTALFVVVVRFIGSKNAITAVASLLMVTLLTVAAIKILGVDRAFYYRPHEMLAVYDYKYDYERYKKNVELWMEGVHGDLQSMTTRSIAHRRDILFRTDSRGFRNDRELRDQPYLLVGDSFIVGNGNSQEETLTELLYGEYGVDAYNLSHVGGIVEYEKYVDSVADRASARRDVLLFVFEGNDFPDVIHPAKDIATMTVRAEYALKRYLHMFQGTSIYRVMRSLRTRLEHRKKIQSDEMLRFEQSEAGEIAFYARYVGVPERAALDPLPEFGAALQRMAPRIAAVFFIPTKYRVYRGASQPGSNLPNAQWEYLAEVCDENGISCYDLKPPLVERSVELLDDGRFTFWRDDTHWNGEGTKLAAEQVHIVLSQQRTTPDRR